ncbi:hypothetical protein B566_EDAN012857 [Ephemera danica]|nr:hypothetical protein B566_EDAN012857 [Ephemera danica]
MTSILDVVSSTTKYDTSNNYMDCRIEETPHILENNESACIASNMSSDFDASVIDSAGAKDVDNSDTESIISGVLPLDATSYSIDSTVLNSDTIDGNEISVTDGEVDNNLAGPSHTPENNIESDFDESDHIQSESEDDEFLDNMPACQDNCPNSDEESSDGSDNETEDNKKAFELLGRRITDIKYFFTKLQELNDHGELFGCNISHMRLRREKRCGLNSCLRFKCDMCHKSKSIWLNDPSDKSEMNVTTAGVAGTMCAGGGFQLLKDVCIAVNMPMMSSSTYQTHVEILSPYWEKAALEEILEAGKEERNAAIAAGDVDVDGVPIITVAGDGSWPKRSNKTKYDALSGVAAIIGMRTGKCLFIGVRNKYCCICARAKNNGVDPSEHLCYLNWNSSSTAMEADIMVEGFLKSEEMHNIRYGRLVADGDSSTYKRIREANPYKTIVVEKIECKNHLLRNLAGRLSDIAQPKRGQPRLGDVESRKIVGSQIANIRKGITMAIKFRKLQTNLPMRDRIQLLRKDMTNAANHYFGEHKNCEQYYCQGAKDSEKNLMPKLRATGIDIQIQKHLSYYAVYATSLIHDLSSNYAEHYNSIVAKFIGGKRINWTQRQSYKDRCNMGVISYNSRSTFYKLHKAMCDKSPGYHSKRMELKQKSRTEEARKRKNEDKTNGIGVKRRRLNLGGTGPDKHYNRQTNKIPLTPAELQQACEQFVDNLKRSDTERAQIECDTRLQLASDGKWLAMRRNFLTSSKFGEVCKRRPTTKNGPLVLQILNGTRDTEYNQGRDTHMKYGTDTEEEARGELAKQLGVDIEKCGLSIDPDIPYLAASPDGKIESDGLVEIKCPSVARDMTIQEGVQAKKIDCLVFDEQTNSYKMKLNHNYFYQVQGQLHCTRRSYCWFFVYTKKDSVKIKVERDDTFWKKCMEPHLIKFYWNCLLPEIVDSQRERGEPVREPQYIIDAIAAAEKSKLEMQKKKEEKMKKKKDDENV